MSELRKNRFHQLSTVMCLFSEKQATLRSEEISKKLKITVLF